MGSISDSSSTSDKVQHSTVQASTPSARLSWNTGFPEPLSTERNTTLRFPGADTSPTACIEDNNIPIVLTQSRRLRLTSRRSKSGSHGFLAPTERQPSMFEDVPFVDDSQEYASEESASNILKAGSGNQLRDGNARKSSGSENGSIGSQKERHRKNLLGIFHHNKH